MSVARNWALGLLLAGTLTCVAISAPQDRASFGSPGLTTAYQPYPTGGLRYQSLQSECGQLAKQYVEAKKDEEKKEIRKKLTDALTQQFDRHIQEQQKELEELEKQIANVKTVLKKRLDAKAAIVERRIEQLVQEAEGLGWNAPGSPPQLYRRGAGRRPSQSRPYQTRVRSGPGS